MSKKIKRTFKSVLKPVAKITNALGPVGTIALGMIAAPVAGAALAGGLSGTTVGSTLFGASLGAGLQSGSAVGLFGAGGVASIKAGSIAGVIGATATKAALAVGGNLLMGSVGGEGSVKSERSVVGTGNVATRTSESVVSEEEKRRRALAGMQGRVSTRRVMGSSGTPQLATAGMLG